MGPQTDQNSENPAGSGRDKTLDHNGTSTGGLSRYLADTAACVRFFSRLPLRQLNRADDIATPPDFSRISRAAPLAGLIVALPAAGFGMLLGYTHLPVMAIAVLTAAMLAVVTGALHEDGLADVADGFFGGSERERRLTIMKDSRIGAFGALSLAFAVLLRVALLAALWDRFAPAEAALLLLSAEVISRFFLVWQWQMQPLARPDGLAARFGKPDARAVYQALVPALVFLIPPLLLLAVPAVFLGAAIGALSALGCGQLGRAKVGGVTGDVLGAIQQVSGLGFLAGIFMVA
ncbi:adenosylcobinamide-GDP ribazoletransferase [Rhodobacterales bacterium]|nr:adenosylcobinamide-GDP ribazoletransferase [Rhodobacterales bacterium]